MTIHELSNDFVEITIRLSYYYNKPYYFISINDEKKKYLRLLLREVNNRPKINIKRTSVLLNSSFHSSLDSNNYFVKSNLNSKNKENIIQIPKNRSSAKNIILSKDSLKPNNLNTKFFRQKSSSINITDFSSGTFKDYEENNNIMNKIDNNRLKINNAKFILIIRIIMSIIIANILIIYIYIIYLKGNIINMSEKIIMSNFYNSQTKDTILNIYSRLLQIFFQISKISTDKVNSIKQQQEIISSFSKNLKENFHNFTEYYFSYNLDLKHDFKVVYDKRQFNNLNGFWEEYEYISKYTTELDIIIYYLFY